MQDAIFQEDVVAQIKENNKLLKDLITKISDRLIPPSADMDNAKWLAGAESAKYLGYDYMYFMNHLRHKYQLDSKRQGRSVYFSKDQLDAIRQRNLSE